MFPTEIWEKILQNINCPKALGRLKLVCMDWNILIEKILQHKISWNNYCSQEITEKCMFNLMNQISEKPEYTYDLVKSSDPMKYNQIWREVYCYWKTWPLFINHPVFIDKLNNSLLTATYKRITHLDVYRDYLGIVTNDNCILFYKLSDLENIYYQVYCTTTLIVQFIFWKTEKADILALTRSVNGVIKFCDVVLKIQGTYNNRGNLISICLEKCYILNRHNVTRVIYDKTVPTLVPIFDCVTSEIPFKDFEFLWKFGSSYYLSNGQCMLKGNQSIGTSAKFYSVDEDLIVAISDKKIWIFLTKKFGPNKWREYNLFHYFHGKIQYFCYHCRLLIFGLDSGTMYIFHLKKESDLEYFDFSPQNGRKIIVDTKPIIAMRIIDNKENRIIVAATHENVYFIHFLSN